MYLLLVGLGLASVVHSQAVNWRIIEWNKMIVFNWNRGEVGTEAGPCMTSFWSNNKNLTYGQDCHYAAGVFFRYNVNSWIGLQTGVNIERVGSRNNFQWTDTSGNPIGNAYIKLQNDYVTFPLLLRFNAFNECLGIGGISLNFTIGGFFSYLFYAKNILAPMPPGTPGDPNPGEETVTNQTSQFNKFNSGIVAGIGVDYSIESGLDIGFEVRDQLGLFHIPTTDPSTNSIVRTNSLQFLFRFSWKFGNRYVRPRYGK